MEIVGLKQKVDDDINKLISKFVGLPVHPHARIMTSLIKNFQNQNKMYFRICSMDDYIECRTNRFTRCLKRDSLVLWNCSRCGKKKCKEGYCRKCDAIQFQEFQERCRKYGFGDGRLRLIYFKVAYLK